MMRLGERILEEPATGQKILVALDAPQLGADGVWECSYEIRNGLQPIVKVPVSSRKNKSQLEDIRAFRGVHGLDDNPTLFSSSEQRREMLKIFSTM